MRATLLVSPVTVLCTYVCIHDNQGAVGIMCIVMYIYYTTFNVAFVTKCKFVFFF